MKRLLPHFPAAARLDKKIMRAYANGLLCILKLVIGCHDNAHGIRLKLLGGLNQLQPGHAVHANVREKHMHRFLLKDAQRFLAGVGAANAVKVGNAAFFQPTGGAVANHLVIINDQYPHARSVLSPW